MLIAYNPVIENLVRQIRVEKEHKKAEIYQWRNYYK